MELLGRVIVYPILWIVYIMLPFSNGPHSSLPSVELSFPRTVNFYRELQLDNPCEALGRYFFVYLISAAVSSYIWWLIFMNATAHNWLVTILLCSILIYIARTLVHVLSVAFAFLLCLFIMALFLSAECLFFFLRLFIYMVIKAVTDIFIVGLKNRRAYQFLSALAAVVLGVTKAKVFASIPIACGIFLTIPDLEPDPWVSFKLRFSHFLMANMDEESLDAMLYSKSFKMVSYNEMMPSLRPVPSTTTVAFFVLRESFSPEDRHFTVEPEYRIGLGSITTVTRRDKIDVHIFTPYSGVRKRTMKNTPRARYNLDMSARFWRDHPEVGILNEVITPNQHYESAKMHCISTDKWITFCGSENYVFMEYDCELGTFERNAIMYMSVSGEPKIRPQIKDF